MDNFEIQRKYMVEKSKQTKPNIPKLSKNSTVAKWDDSIRVYASQVYGARKSTLEYLIRSKIALAIPHPGLATGQNHWAESWSFQGEQALSLSHTHPLYCDENKSLFSVLEVALRGTTFEASIKTFQRTGNGRGAYEALISQHAGKYKWIKIIHDAKTSVNKRKWDVTTSYLLQSHVENCRECYVDIENASEHITEQIPNARTRVQILLDSVEGCTDTKICAIVAAIYNKSSGILAGF